MLEEAAHIRIGELARRTGTTPELLRAWERRYGLLRPGRTAGRFRLYGRDAEERVARMKALIAGGLSAAEAARQTLAEDAGGEPPGDLSVDALCESLVEALVAYDEQGANAVLDQALDGLSVSFVVVGLVLPALREIGDRWRDGSCTVAQEHFASGVLRNRLAGLAGGWGQGVGPRALLACAPDELHDAGLAAFGVLLRRDGWRILYLGANTPTKTLAEAARLSQPDLVVVSSVDAARFAAVERDLVALSSIAPVRLGGAGAGGDLPPALAALALPQDPVEAVRAAAALAQ